MLLMSNRARLAEFSDEQLMDELSVRGWHGTLEHIDDITARREEQDRRHKEFIWLKKIMPKYRCDGRPYWRVMWLVKRVSRNRFLLRDEANAIINKACNKFSGNASNTFNSARLDTNVRALWNGEEIRYASEYENAEAVQEAYEEGRPYTPMKEYKIRRKLGFVVTLQRAERAAKENRKLLSAIKQEIKHGEQHQDSRSVA